MTKEKILNLLKDQTQLIILILLALGISLTTPEFHTVNNFVNLLKQVSVIATISCGMTLVVIGGCLDLSVGSVFSLLNLISITAQQKSDILGIALPICIAIFIGLFNGLIVTVFNVNSIIVTLGSLSVFSGLALLYTGGSIIFGIPDTWFAVIGKGKLAGVPIHVIIFIFIAAFYQIILMKTSFGRKIFYVGTNHESARIVGIRSTLVRTMTFVISSLSVAAAAVMFSSRMITASPVTGVGFEFDAITAVVIGGTSLQGGRGSIIKTIIGVLMLAVIINVLTLYNVPFAFQNVAKGMLIIVAIISDVRSRGRFEK